MKSTKVVWTRQAREDAREIKRFIARDAPRTAEAFVRRLKASVDRLKTFPASGAIVSEIGNPNIREIYYGNYRIIYRIKRRRVEILAVYHSARLLDDDAFDG